MRRINLPLLTVMRRVGIAALGAGMALGMSGGAAVAARPTITVIDFHSFELQAEADWLAMCGFPVDVSFEGHIIVHEFSGQRLAEVDNWQVTISYSANGKTVDLGHPSVGPDHFWIARDGTLYRATSGRDVFEGLVGRSVWNVATDALVSSHGRTIDNPLDEICAMIAP